MKLNAKARLLAALIFIVAILHTGTQMLGFGFRFAAPSTTEVPRSASLPDFSAFEEVQAKKSAFFAYMLPLIEARNTYISSQRQQLLAIAQRADTQLTPKQIERLNDLSAAYKLADSNFTEEKLIDELLIRIDIVPPSLALAQAAVESAWGTSRFAVKANNLFGQWCYEKGCGLIPQRRNTGATHEVEKFNHVSDAISSYARNINTHDAYKDLRASRAKLRAQNAPIIGHTLAEGLLRYSERGEDYVLEVQSVIRVNKLAPHDQRENPTPAEAI